MGEKLGAANGDGKVSPFGDHKGDEMSDSTGANNFLTNPQGTGDKSGGRDFTKESRPQGQAKPEVVPNSQEIPSGGKVLLADPGPVSAKVSGATDQKAPFKGLK